MFPHLQHHPASPPLLHASPRNGGSWCGDRWKVPWGETFLLLNSHHLQTSSTEVRKAVLKENKEVFPHPLNHSHTFEIHPHPCTSRECSKGIWSYGSNFAYTPGISSPRPARREPTATGPIQLSQQKRGQLASISAGERADVALSFRLQKLRYDCSGYYEFPK